MVFYRLLEMRKDNQDVNNLYPSANRVTNRNRRNTIHDRDHPSSPNLDGKARSRSLLAADTNNPRRQRKSLGIGSSSLPPSPLAGSQHHNNNASHTQAPARSISSSSSSGSSSENLQFPVDTSSDHLHPDPLQLSPASTPPGSPRSYRRRQTSHHPSSHFMPTPHSPSSHSHSHSPVFHAQHPPTDIGHTPSSSVPINISDKLRRMRLGMYSTTSHPLCNMLIILQQRPWLALHLAHLSLVLSMHTSSLCYVFIFLQP